MFLNNIRIETGSAYTVHLAMALKILETPPEILGDVVECGTWKGGSATNLSLVCKIVGRNLKIYDSFEGLPEDKVAKSQGVEGYKKGSYVGTLEEVKQNISKYGCLNCCEFIEGYFEKTLPEMNHKIILAYVDVDLVDSLHVCVKNIWPHLTDDGYFFMDECLGTDYIALFFSERWWKKYLNQKPPGLIGGGTGLSLGSYYIGPLSEINNHPLQKPGSGGYTQKSMSGFWTYYSNEE